MQSILFHLFRNIFPATIEAYEARRKFNRITKAEYEKYLDLQPLFEEETQEAPLVMAFCQDQVASFEYAVLNLGQQREYHHM
jgi:hypothetical protein